MVARGWSLAWWGGLSEIRYQEAGDPQLANGRQEKAYAEFTEVTEFAEKKRPRVKRGGVEVLGRKSPPFADFAKDGLPQARAWAA
jgi:hypothetical protein